VLGLVALGVVLRLWLLAHDPLDADQAVVGLMARAIDHGQHPAFFWGQTYGGAEAYVTAAGVALFGLHAWVVNGTAAALSAVAAVAAWQLGRALTGSSAAGAVVGALTWVWSEVDVWNATRETGFRELELVCLLTVFSATASLERGSRPWAAWAALGFACGLGWWASPEILYAAIPVAPAVVVAARRAVRQHGRRGAAPVALGAVLAVAGAAPWLAASATDHLATLRIVGVDQEAGGGYLGRLGTFVTHSAPMLLGARIVVTGAWLGGRTTGLAVLAATVAIAIVGVVTAARRVPLARPLVAAVVVFPLLEAAAGPSSFWRDGRYGLYWPPMVVVAAGAGWYRLLTRRGPAPGARRRAAVTAIAACALAAASTTAGLVAATAVPGLTATTSFAADPLAITGHPDTLARTVVDGLVRRRLTAVYAGYWAAYVLDVVGDGRITATPALRARSASLATSVARAPRQAWLFVGPTAEDAAACAAAFENPEPEPLGLSANAFETILDRAGIRAAVEPVGPMLAVVPAEPVSPGWVLAHRAAR
jgi:hypothetical protein